MNSFHLIAPDNPDRRISLPYAGPVPPPRGRKLANTTILVRDPARPERIWKLTPWEKAESVAGELAIYARLIDSAAPGIVALRGVSGTSAHLARVYDFAPFGELSHFLRRRHRQPRLLESAPARHILAQVAAAMAGMHARGIVHRDLKAENVLVFDDAPLPRVRLGDFDRSVELAPGAAISAPVGSLFHMAPELHIGQPYDHRVDLFAFGILIHEVAHGGARLYQQVASGLPGALTAEEFATAVVAQGLRPEWHHPDEQLGELARRCLSHDPAQRPEFAEILTAVEGRTPPAPSPVAPSSPLPATLGMAATIGLKRRGMEDACCVLDHGGTRILAVFDGFRGDRIAAFSARALALILADMLDQPDIGDGAAIERAFAQVQARIRRLDPMVTAGSTATVAVLRPDRICLGWLGDSPACLLGPDGPRDLIRPHHPDNAAEAQRIAAAGGRLQREIRVMDSGEEIPWGPLRVHGPDGAGGIALTRALGLPALSAIISQQPQVIEVALTHQDRFLVLASDGAFEGLRPEALADIVQAASDPQQGADRVIAEILRRGAPDNASVIVAALPG